MKVLFILPEEEEEEEAGTAAATLRNHGVEVHIAVAIVKSAAGPAQGRLRKKSKPTASKMSFFTFFSPWMTYLRVPALARVASLKANLSSSQQKPSQAMYV